MKRKVKKFQKAVELTFDSLKSHISWTEKGKRDKSVGSVKFHKSTICEYAEILKTLCKLYRRSK